MSDDLIVLLRHAETNFHTESRYQGASDESLLSDNGRAQTRDLQSCIRQLRFAHCFSSPVKRALETVEILLPSLDAATVTVEPALAEVQISRWVGRLKTEIRDEEPNALVLWRTLPHLFFDGQRGRPLLELYGRIRGFSPELIAAKGAKLVVGHDHVNRALISSLLDLPIELHAALPQAVSAISVVGTAKENGLPALHVSNLEHEGDRARGLRNLPGLAQLILVRHGVTQANIALRYQGQKNLPLSDLGREQIVALEEILSDITPSCVVSSGLARAKESAKLLPAIRDVQQMSDARLNEFHYGRWQGLSDLEVESRYPEDKASWRTMGAERPIPDGESISELLGRVSASLSELWEYARSRGPVIVVAHDVVIRAIITLSLRVHFRKLWAFPISNGGVTELVQNQFGTVALSRHNIMPGRLEDRYVSEYL